MQLVREPLQPSIAKGASAVSRIPRPGMTISMARSITNCLECQWLSRKYQLIVSRQNSLYYLRKRKVACQSQLLIGPRWPSLIKKTKMRTMVDFKSKLSHPNAKKHQIRKRKKLNKTKISKKMLLKIVAQMGKNKQVGKRTSTMRETRKGKRAKTKSSHWWRQWDYQLISLDS